MNQAREREEKDRLFLIWLQFGAEETFEEFVQRVTPSRSKSKSAEQILKQVEEDYERSFSSGYVKQELFDGNF